MVRRLVRVVSGLAVVAACAEAPQVGVIGGPAINAPAPAPVPPAHTHFDTSIDLPSDDAVVEPSQPYVATVQERVLAHVHTPRGMCSGVVVGPRLVATAHQCVPDARGVVAAPGEYRVEIASGSLTWTMRTPSKIVAPNCQWGDVDLAVLVLAEPVDWVKPVPMGTVTEPGAKVQALGFGHCAGADHGIRDKAGTILSIDGEAFTIDVGLCRGDVGGFVVDGAGSLLGIVSHQDDPDDSPRRTTTIFREDTRFARRLLAQAQQVADATGPARPSPLTCE